MTSAQQLLALNLGSATIKAALYEWRPNGASAELTRRGDRLELPLSSEGDRGEDGTALLDRITSLLPADAIPPDVIVHRIVHGGPFAAPALLTEEVVTALSAYADMDPLHQAASLKLVEASRARWANAQCVAAFDTTWHRTLANWSRRLPIPQSLHDAGIQRYGFHGLAFQSAMRQVQRLDKTAGQQRIVLAHLGAGSSLCAVYQGLSVDTTMGLTPLDGLPMATRCGTLDPGVILYLERKMAMPAATIERMLWRESGLLGVSGFSGDMRKLLAASDASSRLAVELFVMRVAQGIAAMATGLRGFDAIIFTGGIGSHSPVIRQRVADTLEWTGLRIDREKNRSGAVRLDAKGSSAKIWAIAVDEEYELAVAGVTAVGPAPTYR
ncbi:MAG: propionate/acetate kinase [Lysobacter sp.]